MLATAVTTVVFCGSMWGLTGVLLIWGWAEGFDCPSASRTHSKQRYRVSGLTQKSDDLPICRPDIE